MRTQATLIINQQTKSMNPIDIKIAKMVDIKMSEMAALNRMTDMLKDHVQPKRKRVVCVSIYSAIDPIREFRVDPAQEFNGKYHQF